MGSEISRGEWRGGAKLRRQSEVPLSAWLVVWLSGNALVAINKLLDAEPVNTGMGDCLRAGIYTMPIGNQPHRSTQPSIPPVKLN